MVTFHHWLEADDRRPFARVSIREDTMCTHAYTLRHQALTSCDSLLLVLASHHQLPAGRFHNIMCEHVAPRGSKRRRRRHQ